MRIVIIAVIIGLFVVSAQIYKGANKTTPKFLPKGAIVAYEDFRGCKVPILSDGKGGQVRWVADVPWDKFSIEEKFDMARVGGGKLSDNDIQEIKTKYGVR